MITAIRPKRTFAVQSQLCGITEPQQTLENSSLHEYTVVKPPSFNSCPITYHLESFPTVNSTDDGTKPAIDICKVSMLQINKRLQWTLDVMESTCCYHSGAEHYDQFAGDRFSVLHVNNVTGIGIVFVINSFSSKGHFFRKRRGLRSGIEPKCVLRDWLWGAIWRRHGPLLGWRQGVI